MDGRLTSRPPGAIPTALGRQVGVLPISGANKIRRKIRSVTHCEFLLAYVATEIRHLLAWDHFSRSTSSRQLVP